MLGGIYPDVEKVLSVDLHIPDRFVLFGWHSTFLSTRTAGLAKSVLIALECVLIAGFLLVMWKIKRGASNRSVDSCGVTGVSPVSRG